MSYPFSDYGTYEDWGNKYTRDGTLPLGQTYLNGAESREYWNRKPQHKTHIKRFPNVTKGFNNPNNVLMNNTRSFKKGLKYYH